ncbi:MAG: SMC family ATPase, partial [Chloroflexi bacterium]|nr:SMC family ATPase [Chloroflexota bacterium]
GRTEMEVEFEFALAGDLYRVIRKHGYKRGPKRVQSVGALEFQIFGDPEFRSITGNTKHETQRKINEVLRMDYDTFINSAFLRQGRADEFTLKPPDERKRVLADILGLGFYDELAERARERARRCEMERRELQSAVREIELELARRPDYERQLALVQTELHSLANAIIAGEAEVTALEARKKELDIKARQVGDLRERIARAERELKEIRAQVEEHRRKIEEYEKVIVERENIERGHARLVDARAANEELNQKLSGLFTLKDRVGALERAINDARCALQTRQQAQLAAIQALQSRREQGPAWRRELADVEGKLLALAGLDARREEARELVQSCRSQIEVLKATNNRLVQEMNLLKEKIQLLETAGPQCPLCESDLGPAGRDRIAKKFQEEGRAAGDTYRQNSAEVKSLEQKAQAALQKIAVFDRELKERESLQRRATTLEKSLADAAEAEAQIAAHAGEAEQIRVVLDGEGYARSERGALSEALAEIAALNYDAERHKRTGQLLASLRDFEGLKTKLDMAVTRIDEEREAQERLLRAAERWQTVLDEDLRASQSMRLELSALPEVERSIAQARGRLDQQLAQQADARLRLGRVQQMVNHCQYLEQQRRQKEEAERKVGEEKSLCDDLALAFGRKGIQAMIIDSAIPEIEDEANTLLARMTDNRLHVTLETQREKKTGDAVVETLEIRIADELGPRSYETYSGGEAFRVNFSLRIALSKLLARRAGAKLQTLIVDEGFGTQDTFGRERLVEAINSISEDFEKIIVITHIQELKDAFPHRIDVVKDADGSQLVMN